VKKALFESKQIEVDSQKLIHRGKALDNAKTLGEYEIKDGDTLIVMVSKVGHISYQPTTKSVQQNEPAPVQHQ
jgi:hypothetical protein